MPVSKGRRKQRRKPTGQARKTQAAQADAEAVRSTPYRIRRNRRILAWSLMGLGAFVGVFHVASPGVEDLFIGYPTALLLLLVGAMLLPAR
jgi:hypothetical protein